MSGDSADAATPSQAALAYKLALAILGTLQEKGLLTGAEVDRVLLAAKLAATPRAGPAAEGPPAPLLDLDLSGG